MRGKIFVNGQYEPFTADTDGLGIEELKAIKNFLESVRFENTKSAIALKAEIGVGHIADDVDNELFRRIQGR